MILLTVGALLSATDVASASMPETESLALGTDLLAIGMTLRVRRAGNRA